MINTTLTGITHTSYTTTTDIPFAINDTFYSNSNISFTCTAAGILDILSKTINAGNITNFALYYRLIDNTTTNTTILSDTIDLTAGMFVNNSIIVSLDDLNNTITHNYLLDDMNENEIFSLHKKYNLVIRIYQKSTAEETTHLANLNTILATDIVQDLNYILNGIYEGPYSVGFEHVDLANKNEFSLDEIKQFLLDNTHVISDEYFRIYYPKNIQKNSTCPLFVFFHGQGQLVEDYDFYYSRLASYGYVCIGIHHITSYGDYILSLEYSIKKLDYFKNNLNKIKNGIFENLIDFTKINFSGHSRGGGYSLSISELIKIKNLNSKISNTFIDYNHIKTIIPIAQVSTSAYNITYLSNGADSSFSVPIPDSIANNNKIQFNIPTLNLLPRLDNDVVHTASFFQKDFKTSYLNGFSFDIKRNISENIILLSNNQFNHNTYAISILNREDPIVARNATFQSAAPGDKSAQAFQAFPKFIRLLENNFSYNSTNNIVNYLGREILNFIALHNFNSNKIRKIRFLNRSEYHNYDQNIKNFYSTNIKYNIDNINFYIDDFNGITMSLAGPTGMTFNNTSGLLGFTYDYCQEYNIGRRLQFASSIYENNIYQQKTHIFSSPQGLTSSYTTTTPNGKALSQSKSFCGFFHTTYKGVEFDVNNLNTFIGYTFATNLDFDEDSYFVIKGGLPDKSYSFVNTGAGRTFGFEVSTNGIEGNTLDANFSITLYDTSNNNASLSSNLYNYGFPKNLNMSSDPLFYHYSNESIKVSIECIYFRAGDFYLKNPNLDLSNINQILLSFGPGYGSTHCTVGLDEFFVLKNF